MEPCHFVNRPVQARLISALSFHVDPADRPTSPLFVSENIEYCFVYLEDSNPLHLTQANNVLSAASRFHLLHLIKASYQAVLPIISFRRFDD